MNDLRFVVIASLRRGAIEPAEALDDENQARACSRFDADDCWLGETVVWNAGRPVIGSVRQPGCERRPSISADLRAALRGRPMQFDDNAAEQRRRAGIPARR
jgi:hypothetical protein